MKRQPVAQAGRRKLVVEPFIERDHAKPRRHVQRQPVTLDSRLPRVHRRNDMDISSGRYSFGHRQDQHATIGLGEQPPLGDGAPGPQRRIEIEPAQQAAVSDVQRHMFQRLRLRQGTAQQRQPSLAHRTRARAQQHAGAERIDREQLRGNGRVGPCRVHAKTSAMARSTRTVEPASSSGLRRRRWRKAGGAMRRR